MQVGIGLTSGANGPQLGPVLMLTNSGTSEPEAPKSYENHFETSEGVHIHVTYHTEDKELADRYSNELIDKTAWKKLETAPEGPASLASDVFGAAALGLFAPIIIGFIGFLVFMAFHMAGYLTFRELNENLSAMVRYCLWAMPILALVLAGVAFLQHSSEK